MTLDTVLTGVRVSKLVRKPLPGPDPHDVTVGGIQYDSRKLQRGEVFVAIRGSKIDGHRFIPDAIGKGVVAIILEDDASFPDSLFTHAGVVKVVVPRARLAMAEMACNFYDHPSRKVRLIGVTGTNGKTTTVHLLRSVLEASGARVGLIGTMGYYDGKEDIPARHTTPESTDLNLLLSSMVDNGCSTVVMEVSSHAIEMSRVHGLSFTAAAFTNLTQDHLDFHGSMENYFLAKKKLFDSLMEKCLAVTNADDPYGERIVEDSAGRKVTYGLKSEADFVGTPMSSGLKGIRLSVRAYGEEQSIASPLAGSFNTSNLLASYTTCSALGLSHSIIEKGIGSLKAVRGRFEPVRSAHGWTAIIDYAHTPDALRNSLDSILALKKGSEGRVITIFGCGGDRDKGKRPLMGSVATEFSDICIVTSDNPRSEDPAAIIREVLKGMNKKKEIIQEIDRRRAIRRGLSMAREGDIVLIAGKGHETYQVIGTGTVHFDDREEVERFLGGRDGTDS